MTLWRSPHPDVEIPTDVTTWEWLFETEQNVPFSSQSKQLLGTYSNAATNESLDFAQVKEKAVALSTALVRDYGLQPGQTVSLFSNNTIWYPVALWAAIRAGGLVNGASPAYTVEEMTHALITARTKILFTLPGSLEVAVSAARNAGVPSSHIFLLEGTAPADDFSSLQDLIRRGSTMERPVPYYRIPRLKSNKDVCGYLNFSSGTTGLPKAVMLSHYNVIAQCLQMRPLLVLPDEGRSRTLAVMPLFHITGLVRFITYPVLVNGDCYMLPAFKMDLMLETIIRYRIEDTTFVPPILIRLVRDSVVDRYMPQLRATIKSISTGAAPTSPEVIKLLQARFPGTGFRQGYGATESTMCITCHPPSHFDYRYANTGGLLVANTVAKVIDLADGRRMLGPGETGEICARGPQIAMGYLDNPEATAETFDDEGFLHTGDVGHFDDEGLVHIEDRIKEMIKVKGLQVPPAELEDLLLGHELVDDCAVLGIPDEYAGERPKAFIVPRKGVPVCEETGRRLLQYVRENKVRYKWLVEVEFADSIPKSPAGKLLRRTLKMGTKDSTRKKGLCVRDETGKARL